VYYRARYYSPGIGRFVSRDPIGLQGGVNLYSYVNDNPVNYTDPMGLLAQSPIVVAQGGTNYFGNTMTDVGNGLTSASQSVQSLVQTSLNAGANETIGGTLDKLIQGSPIGPEVAGLGVAVGSIKSAGQLGREGEAAVQAAYDIGNKATFEVNGNRRIADGLNNVLNTISEVKNTTTQAFTSQLRDYVTYAQQEGLKFDLYVRDSTVLSAPLKDAISSGLIRFNLIPKP
jgi:uncharacterized protein RhaS with RHS repeats